MCMHNLSIPRPFYWVNTFGLIKAVSDTIFDMIVTTYHDKPLILSGATFRERSVSHHRAMKNAVSSQHGKKLLAFLIKRVKSKKKHYQMNKEAPRTFISYFSAIQEKMIFENESIIDGYFFVFVVNLKSFWDGSLVVVSQKCREKSSLCNSSTYNNTSIRKVRKK